MTAASQWMTKVAPYAAPGVNPDTERGSESLPLRLYRVSVEVVFPSANGGRRTLALATTRIGFEGRAVSVVAWSRASR